MDLKEIKKRADTLSKDLPLGVWMTLNQLAQLADISTVTIWRLPADEKPDTIRMAGAEMIQIDAGIAWADRYWRRQEAKKQARGAK